MPAALRDAIHAGPGRVLMIVGTYGSGKTEVSVNLALQLAAGGETVQIADLDLVNPYFRCREAREAMEAAGIRVIVPPGAQQWADLPIVLPEIQGLMRPPEGTLSMFDVGGDDVGARALASFRPILTDGRYELWQVINSRRPFSDSVSACKTMRASIEAASRLAVTGLLVNSHLGDETTPEVVLEGWRLGREVSDAFELPLRCVAVMDEVADADALAAIDVPLLRLQRHLLPPWLVARDEPAPTLHAARPVPIGRPPASPLPGDTHG
ncbi:MAG: cobalamin biosynthesis protein CbiA [Planctomycetota bacterium]